MLFRIFYADFSRFNHEITRFLLFIRSYLVLNPSISCARARSLSPCASALRQFHLLFARHPRAFPWFSCTARAPKNHGCLFCTAAFQTHAIALFGILVSSSAIPQVPSSIDLSQAHHAPAKDTKCASLRHPIPTCQRISAQCPVAHGPSREIGVSLCTAQSECGPSVSISDFLHLFNRCQSCKKSIFN